jgi:glycosyltransferase involved in cell wall biosynthesis
MRLVYVATDPITAFRLMDGQLGYMQRHGFDVSVISGPGALLDQTAAREGVRAVGIPMLREPAPAQDIVALARLTLALRRLRPTIVNAGTPKAGLLGVLAARLARVPVVVYLLRGLRYEGAKGARRLLLCGAEHVAGGLCDRVFVNSESLRARFVDAGCAARSKTWVPAAGSSNGVEAARFRPTPERRAWALEEKARRGIPPDAIVAGFVGRFTRDKGLVELLSAFRAASAVEPRLRLLLVGDHDKTDPLPAEARLFIAEDPRVITTGFVDEPARFYSMMDLFVFPSHREGFPNAPLEAAAAGLPVLAWSATGTIDAVADGATGTLLEPGDEQGLTQGLLDYARDQSLRDRHGRQGRQRVEGLFSRERVWAALADEYRRLASERVPFGRRRW